MKSDSTGRLSTPAGNAGSVPTMETAQADKLSIRLLDDRDSIAELTSLLHRAYARLARLGLNYVAIDQSEAVTRERIAGSQCAVALCDNKIVGTILLKPPAVAAGCHWYDRPDVAAIAQFGVEPGLQGLGIGGRLMRHAEMVARELGAHEIALDTAEPARHLINFYSRLGYRPVDLIQWPHANYRSLVMSKSL